MAHTVPCAGPHRYSHFDGVDAWVKAGYPRQAVAQWLAVTKQQLDSPNSVTELRTLGGIHYRLSLGAAAQKVSIGAATPEAAAAALAASLRLFYNDASPDAAERMRVYRYSIDSTLGQERPPPPPPSSAPSATRAPQPPVISSDPIDSDDPQVVVPSVVLPVLLMAAIVVWAVSRYRHHAAKSARKYGRIHHPELGDDTTLVVTDVEGSTALWEVMDEAVMDIAFNLHHDCMRRTGIKWRGYETQTAGDSFTFAFHTATDAVNFCFDAQVRRSASLCFTPNYIATPGGERVGEAPLPQ